MCLVVDGSLVEQTDSTPPCLLREWNVVGELS